MKRAARQIVSIAYGVPRRGLPSPSSFRIWVAAAVIGARRRDPVELGIRLVDEDEARRFNHRYRGRDYATNVLSFPAELPRGIAPALLGDLAICPAVVAREATAQGKRTRDHYAHLTIHGVLHLLGLDHSTKAQACQMEALECEILAGLGIADPYTIGDMNPKKRGK